LIQSERKSNTNECGAKAATGNISILHCDSLPPRHFDRIIDDTVQNGNQAGCFRMKFDYRHPVLMISSGSLDSITFPAAAGINRYL
jgi:hypothetical protein